MLLRAAAVSAAVAVVLEMVLVVWVVVAVVAVRRLSFSLSSLTRTLLHSPILFVAILTYLTLR